MKKDIRTKIKVATLHKSIRNSFSEIDTIQETDVPQFNSSTKVKLNVDTDVLLDTHDIETSIDRLYKHFTSNLSDKFASDVLFLIYEYLNILDENKSLTLTDEQYRTWLNSNNVQYITTKQFQVLFGLTARQQKEQRIKLHDPLPYTQLGESTNILYNRLEVQKWFENYKKK